MTRIRLQHLKPGMLISEDAKTHLGKLVISRGTRLTEDSIQTLKAWGIPEVEVMSPDSILVENGNGASTDSEINGEVETQVKVLFTKSNSEHPAIQELIRLAVHSRLP